MTAKISASADGTKVNIGNAAENALQIDSTAKTIKALAPYTLAGDGPIFRGVLASFVNTAIASQVVTLTPTKNDRVTVSGNELRPTVAGWYQCSFSGLCTGTTVGLGLGLISTNNMSQFQVQPPYGTNNAYVTVSSLIYFNGTTDKLQFAVFGTVTGCAFTDLIGSMVLVRQP